MEALERLASSIAQTELLVAALRRENRELAARLASLAAERHAEGEALRAELEALGRRVGEAESAPKRDPGLEARAFDAEDRAGRAEAALAEALAAHSRERSRLESLIRQLEAQVMASHGAELLPTASAEALEESHARERSAQTKLSEAQNRALLLEAQARGLQTRLDTLLEAERRAGDGSEALRSALEALRGRGADLERSLSGRERELESLRAELAATAADRAGRERDLDAALAERAGLGQELDALRAELEAVRSERDGARLALDELKGGSGRQLDALRAELESSAAARAELERGLESLRGELGDADALRREKADLRRQRREAQAAERERQSLRRRVEELLATLESARL